MTARFAYGFDDDNQPGRDLLGGKGAGLAEMTALGLPVPPGFTVTTEACRSFHASGELPARAWAEILLRLRQLENASGKGFGDRSRPLLVSVRSGAPVSMPGMMDTILNVGLNDETVEGLAKASGDEVFALDSYRRLIQMYGEIVEGVPEHKFTAILDEAGLADETPADAERLREVIGVFKQRVLEASGSPFPQEPLTQLRSAIASVFRSWTGRRARIYRAKHGIADDLGTAATIVAMVFGNLGSDSGTGVAFTRNPATGEPGIFGEFLATAQGEDVVRGTRTPSPISEMSTAFPAAWSALIDAAGRLEQHYRDMQDIEFTIERGTLYVLQTRTGKRTAAASVRIAVDLTTEGVITEEEGIQRVEPGQLAALLRPSVPANHGLRVAATGLPASPGAACGFIAFDADDAELRASAGEQVILVRPETSPDDIHGFFSAEGILTARGGMTSHAAVVARGLGKPCVTACNDLAIDPAKGSLIIDGQALSRTDRITIDGATGEVFIGEVELVAAQRNESLVTLLAWADGHRRLGVLANADTPDDAARALEFGAEGIGLCRTEHMFFGADRLPLVQETILAESAEGRVEPLRKLARAQEDDFHALFTVMGERPVIIRLLDPPLHEFLPDESEATSDRMRERIRELREANPMLGMRGSRLGLMLPDLYEMQAQAIARACARFRSEHGYVPPVRIMLPLITYVEEMSAIRSVIQHALERETRHRFPIGTMLEVPRACIVAAELMSYADFFSFGTNDLTQMTLGLSRDDAERTFLAKYLGDGLIGVNPFGTIDTQGVGWLVRHAVNSTRAKDSSFSIGACGEHAGEPASIQFFHDVGVGYVSCSPYRIQEARLAAAQAALRSGRTSARHQETPNVPATRVNGTRNGSRHVSDSKSKAYGAGEVRIRTGS